MRLNVISLILGLLATVASAAEAPRAREDALGAAPAPAVAEQVAPDELVRAAREQAVAKLYSAVADLPLVPRSQRVTVHSFLRDVGARNRFMEQTLAQADQIGGPRWIDATRVQVHLEISAAKVSQELQALAIANAKTSPVTAEQIERASADWDRRTFAVIGTVSSALSQIRPHGGAGAWRAVEDAQVRQALAAASQDAARSVIASISPVVLKDGATIGDAMALPAVRNRVREWLCGRPTTGVSFQPDLTVEVALSVDPHDLSGVIRTAWEQQEKSQSGVEWDRVEQDVSRRLAPAVGRAKAAGNGAVAVSAAPVPRPAQAPPWVGPQIDIRGTADAVPVRTPGALLKARAVATLNGRAKLRERLESLPWDRKMTVGEAAQRDPAIAQAVSRVVGGVDPPYKTEIRADGSVVVYLMLDTRKAWEELRR